MIPFAPYSPTTPCTPFCFDISCSAFPLKRRANPWCDAAFIHRRGPWSGHPTRRFIQTSDPVSCNETKDLFL